MKMDAGLKFILIINSAVSLFFFAWYAWNKFHG